MQQFTLSPTFHYYQKGREPKLLIHAGTHGDEYEVIDLVTENLERYYESIPDFLYVPRVSPTAVESRTRVNARGMDLNRIFVDGSDDEEVLLNQRLLQGKHFDLFISFHEDPVEERFYVYDVGSGDKSKFEVDGLLGQLEANTIELLTGYDDEDDADLGYWFERGYRYFKHEKSKSDSGMIIDWLMNRGVVNHCLLPEIPGKLTIEKKRVVVEGVFGIITVL